MNGATLRRIRIPGIIALSLFAIAVLVPLLPLHDVTEMRIPQRFAPPSWRHWLGLDEFGRDILARILWGARASLTIAVGAALISALIGTLLGLLGGYFRGMTEVIAVRSTEVILCLPPLLLALLVVTLLGAGTATLIIALSILFVPGYARIVFAATLQVRSLDYVTARESLGAHPATIIAKTVLPNILPPLLVQASLTVAAAMMLESGLSFLGLGVVPPEPSLGLMIRSARAAIDIAPMLLVWPSLVLAGIILVLNLLCDRLRDALDPRGAPAGGATWLRRRPRRAGAAPARDRTDRERAGTPILDARGLSVSPASADATDGEPLVRDVDLEVRAGETLVLVGESGSGKTLTGLAVSGLLPDNLGVSGGEARFTDRRGRTWNLAQLEERDYRLIRGDGIGMVFQDAGASLNPVHRIGDLLAEAMTARHRVAAGELQQRVTEALSRVGLPDPEQRAQAYPHELSGGQRQRAMLAIALANRPRLLIADEPTTALDPTIQLQILKLFEELKHADDAMGTIFITHDLAVAAEIGDRIAVMYAGEIVEDGPLPAVFARPRHPYTAALLAAATGIGTDRPFAAAGKTGGGDTVRTGCRFAPRCEHAERPCARRPSLEPLATGRRTRCVRWREVT